MSAEPTTSPASLPMLWPTCAPHMETPTCCIMPTSGPAACAISGGSDLLMASETRAASGSTRSFQAAWVPSTHSARLQVRGEPPVDGNVVAPSSQVSASRNASSTSRRSLPLTERSPAAETTSRAAWLARSQFTGPPDQENIWPSCWNMAPRSGLPPGPPGPPGPNMPNSPPNGSSGPEPPAPPEPAPDFSGRSSSGSSEERKPKGTSFMAAPRAGWEAFGSASCVPR